MINKYIYTILFCLINTLSFAQSKMITGKIIIDDKVVGQDVLDGILVQNLQTDAKTTTNINGDFSIRVSVGDELLFKHDFYQERSVKISDAMLNRGIITIHLNIEVVELDEAKVNRLDKNWKNNIKVKKTEKTEFYEALGLDPNMQYAKVNPNATALLNNNGIMDPTEWFGVISGQKKKAKKQDQYFKKVDKIKELQDFFTDYYFTEDLHIPENKVENFVNYCYTNFGLEKLVKDNKYDKIEEIFQTQAPIYINYMNKSK